MKRHLFVLVLSLLSVLYVQGREISMSSILSKAGEVVNLVERELNCEIVRMEFDIIHSKKHTFRTLTDDYEYVIVAFGDYRIKDIDVKIYKWIDNSWSLIEQDNDSKAVAVVSVKPGSTSDYKIEITAYEFNEGYSVGHYGLVICHE